jgi:hypothetical protein
MQKDLLRYFRNQFCYTSRHNLVQTGLIVLVALKAYQVYVFIVFWISLSSRCHGYYEAREVHLLIAVTISTLFLSRK